MKTFIYTLLIAALAFSQSAEQKGLDITKEMDKRDTGFKDSQVSLTMTLKNQQGQQSVRYMRNKTLEGTTDGDKSMIIFDRPTDVKGTATLTYTHKEGSDDQWLYLPAIKRVKRISSNNKSGPFMGSEFAYEDLSSQEVEKYTYKYIKDEKLNGADMFVVERYPVDPKSGYTKQIVWISKEHYRPEKIDYYDRKDELLKTLTYYDYKQYLDKFWRADRFIMANHQTGKSTELVFEEYKFGVGLREKDFNKNSLKRAR